MNDLAQGNVIGKRDTPGDQLAVAFKWTFESSGGNPGIDVFYGLDGAVPAVPVDQRSVFDKDIFKADRGFNTAWAAWAAWAAGIVALRGLRFRRGASLRRRNSGVRSSASAVQLPIGPAIGEGFQFNDRINQTEWILLEYCRSKAGRRRY